MFSFLGELITTQPPMSRKPSTLGNLEMPSLITENKKNRYKSTEYERILTTNEQGEEITVDMPKSNHPPTSLLPLQIQP